MATSDPDNPGGSVPVGAQSARGIELAGGLQLTPKLSLQGNVAFVDPKYDDFSQSVGGVAVSRNGNVPTNTPRRLANVWLDYAFVPDWNASVAARHVGRAYADAANTVWAPPYTVFDAALSHRINRNLNVTARVRNLTDKVYAANATPTMFYLGAPRSVELTIARPSGRPAAIHPRQALAIPDPPLGRHRAVPVLRHVVHKRRGDDVRGLSQADAAGTPDAPGAA
ncbi:hypothetical protein G6F57_018284 [Rhizopus arrhizus]|nr:hypothetical protein G6F57_018284 [Rhizopus arrhizus]